MNDDTATTTTAVPPTPTATHPFHDQVRQAQATLARIGARIAAQPAHDSAGVAHQLMQRVLTQLENIAHTIGA